MPDLIAISLKGMPPYSGSISFSSAHFYSHLFKAHLLTFSLKSTPYITFQYSHSLLYSPPTDILLKTHHFTTQTFFSSAYLYSLLFKTHFHSFPPQAVLIWRHSSLTSVIFTSFIIKPRFLCCHAHLHNLLNTFLDCLSSISSINPVLSAFC